MTFLKFSRDAEREADLLGLEYDYAAGYDPQAFVQFFEKLNADEKTKHSKLAKMFSTHPMNGDRVTAAQNEIRQFLPDREKLYRGYQRVRAGEGAPAGAGHEAASGHRR